MTPMDVHMTFDFAILKLEIDKSMKTKKKNLKILTNTQNPLKTSLINLIWSNLVILEPTLKFDQRLTKFNRLWSFAGFDCSVLTIWSSDCHYNLRTQIFHRIQPIQRLDFGSPTSCMMDICCCTHLLGNFVYPHWHNPTIQNGWNTP